MILSSITYEPWESVYMWFLAPGLLLWIGAAIWWAKNRMLWLPLVVQLAGGFGAVTGGIAAYMAGISSSRKVMIEAGFWDPSVEAGDRAFFAEIMLIGWGLHWVMLIGTLIMAIATNKRITKNTKSDRNGD